MRHSRWCVSAMPAAVRRLLSFCGPRKLLRRNQAGLIAKMQYGQEQTAEIRSPIPGRIRSVAGTGANVAAGAKIAVVDPSTEQVWEALRALYLVGQLDDLPAILPYERDLPDISNDVRQQAVETEKAIRGRASATDNRP